MGPAVAWVVSALSAGALAVGSGYATEAIKDGYKQLKSFLVANFVHAAPFVEVVDKKPSEATVDLLAEQIAPAEREGGDEETEKKLLEAKALADTLRTAIEAVKNEPHTDAVIKLLDLITGDIKVDNTRSSGRVMDMEHSRTGDISVTNSDFTGNPKKKPEPRLIALHD
jgi:hypothetical protein